MTGLVKISGDKQKTTINKKPPFGGNQAQVKSSSSISSEASGLSR